MEIVATPIAKVESQPDSYSVDDYVAELSVEAFNADLPRLRAADYATPEDHLRALCDQLDRDQRGNAAVARARRFLRGQKGVRRG